MTEKEMLRQLEKQLNEEYKDTQDVLKDKIKKLTKEFESANKEELKKLEKGEITRKQYIAWYRDQVVNKEWCNDMIKELSKDMTETNVKASEIINGYTSDVFLKGAEDGMIELNKGVNFDLIDSKQVKGLLEENKPLLPKAKVPISKDQKWNERRMRSAVLQSALKGESIPKLAMRLEHVVGMNKTSSVRNARTMMTCSHNMGKLETAREAEEMGINVKKVWIATFDKRTRDSHSEMHGVVVDVEEPFELTNHDGSTSELMYPGDPDGDPEQVYNCRCTMGYIVEPPEEKE